MHTGAQGKGPKSRAAPNRVVAETRTAPVTECRACGRDLEGVAPAGHERRRLVDLVFETRELTVEAEIKTCPRCRTEQRGAFPKEMPGPLQYGPGIVAFAVHLLTAQMVSLKRTAQTLKALTGRAIAEATLLAWLWRLHEALADWEAAALERLLTMPPCCTPDETSLRVERKNHWLHSYGFGNLTLKFVHPRRGRAALDELNVIPRYGGILIHDRWASYFAYQNCKHALCGSHLLRDLTFVEDAHGHAWAKRLKKLLLDTCRSVREHPDKALDEAACKALRKRYRTLLTQARRELPKPPKRLSGQRGRIAKSDPENLHEALVQYETEVLRFARDPNVPFTNNRAERDIRMAKVKQKVSGCFRTPALRRRLLPHLQLPAVHGTSGIQPTHRNPNRAQRQSRYHDRKPNRSGSGGRVVTGWRNEVAFIDRGISKALESAVHEFRQITPTAIEYIPG